MSSTTYDIVTRVLTRLMSNIPHPEPRFQPQSQTSEEIALWTAFKMRDNIISAITKKRF